MNRFTQGVRLLDTARRVKPLRRSDPDMLGRYRLLGRLGSGGMGVVYLAEDPRHRLVAIKLVHAMLSGDTEFLGRFRSEISRARQVPAFCTAEVLEADLEHEPPFLVVEYVDGPSLSEVVGGAGPLSGSMLDSVATGVATALVGIHGAGVIHRDLKPENVLLPPGSPKVIDFGIARAFEATSRHTRTDQFVGTVAYMAPERFDNEPGLELTAAADVFAWGCVIGYAGSGRTPFHGDTPTVTAARILTQPPYLEGLDRPLRDLVEHALAKNPADRPTAREVLDTLVAGRTDIPAQRRPARSAEKKAAPRPEVPQRHVAPPARRGTRKTTTALLAGALLLAGVAGVGLAAQRIEPAPRTAAESAAPPTGGAAGGPGPLTSSAPSRAGLSIPSLPIPTVRKTSPKPRPAATLAPVPPSGLSHAARLAQWVGPDVNPCDITGLTLTVGTTFDGLFPCGHGTTAEDITDHSVTIEAAVTGGDACVGYWFHWFDDAGGDLVRICRDEISVEAMRFGNTEAYGRIVVPDPPAAGERFTTRVDVRGRNVTLIRGGKSLGTVALTAEAPVTGRSVLGMTARKTRGSAPYEIRIHDADLVRF